MRLLLARMAGVLALVSGLATQALAGTIDFSADTPGAKLDGFTSPGHPLAHFFDLNGSLALGGGLYVGDFGGASDGQGLAVFDDEDGSFLAIGFEVPATSIALDFGNDLAERTNPGDLAVLLLLSDFTLVDFVTMELNRDGLMNQTIAYGGAPFNQAFFAYTNPSLSPFTGGGAAPIGLIEVVDNITYETSAPVPEPATVGLLGLGLLGTAARRRLVSRSSPRPSRSPWPRGHRR